MADGDTSAAAGAALVEDGWGDPPRPPRAPVVHLDGYDGPLDLVERRRIAVGRLSAAALVDQVVAELARLASERRWPRVPTGCCGPLGWCCCARGRCRPTSIRARRPRPPRFGGMRVAAAWLSARPQLGWDEFARPAGLAPRITDYMDLMHACLRMQRVAARRRSAARGRQTRQPGPVAPRRRAGGDPGAAGGRVPPGRP